MTKIKTNNNIDTLAELFQKMGKIFYGDAWNGNEIAVHELSSNVKQHLINIIKPASKELVFDDQCNDSLKETLVDGLTLDELSKLNNYDFYDVLKYIGVILDLIVSFHKGELDAKITNVMGRGESAIIPEGKWLSGGVDFSFNDNNCSCYIYNVLFKDDMLYKGPIYLVNRIKIDGFIDYLRKNHQHNQYKEPTLRTSAIEKIRCEGVAKFLWQDPANNNKQTHALAIELRNKGFGKDYTLEAVKKWINHLCPHPITGRPPQS